MEDYKSLGWEGQLKQAVSYEYDRTAILKNLQLLWISA